ncbi:terpenoid synthase [Phellopilus nigrolimitatus]|nr:terpenoid synthase [Phellopilus nigrolimitatus]
MHPSSSSNIPQEKAKLVVIPDLVADCPFVLHLNINDKKAGAQSDSWLSTHGNLSAKKQTALRGLRCGLLTEMTYPDAWAPQLRTCCDFLSFLFHLDDLSDGMDRRGTLSTREVVIGSICDPTFETDAPVGRMAKDIWRRIAVSASEGTKVRFIDTFDRFFRAVAQQAVARHAEMVLDLDAYIALRRDTSGCKPCWALIEYANGLNIPDHVMAHEAVDTLGEAANDLVSWSNDIFSFKVEHARGDTHNMIVIAMRTMGLSLQDSIDYVGELCTASIERFLEAKRRLPSFDQGGRVDHDVALYTRGLEDWIVGSLHWSFESTRYFGAEGRGIKKTRVVELARTSMRVQLE